MFGKIKVLFGLTDFQKMLKGDVDVATEYMLKIVSSETFRVIDLFKTHKEPLDHEAAVMKAEKTLKDSFPTVPMEKMKLMRAYLVLLLKDCEIAKIVAVVGYLSAVILFLSQEFWNKRSAMTFHLIKDDERVAWMNKVAVEKAFFNNLMIIKIMVDGWKDDEMKSDLLDIMSTLRCDPLADRRFSFLEQKALVAMMP